MTVRGCCRTIRSKKNKANEERFSIIGVRLSQFRIILLAVSPAGKEDPQPYPCEGYHRIGTGKLRGC